MQLSDFNVTKQLTTLENGVPLLVFERPGMPISIKVAFFNGSRFDPEGKEGLAHFAEHMIVSGTKQFPTKHDVGLFVESLGASFNASTSADKMDVYVDYAIPEDTAQVVNLLDQFLSHSLFEASTIERERGAIMAELAGKMSDPGVYIYRLWRQAAYQGSSLGRDTIGTDESLLNISREDLLEYYSKRLKQGRCVIVASGDITAENLAKHLNKAEFITSSDYKPRSIAPVKRNRSNPIFVKNYPHSEQIHLMLGFPVPDEAHEDFWALYILTRILGSGRTSRLHTKLRNELGLVYSASANLDPWYGSSSLVAYTSCKIGNTQPVLDAITHELASLKSIGVTEEELSHRKNYLTKLQLLRMQTSNAWVGYHADSFLKHPDSFTSIEQDLIQINAVTREQVQHVAHKYFKPDSWYMAACGDISAGQISINF